MLAILIIILVLLGAAVVGSIYSNFMVFYSNFSETENYHKAYYASISALERGELATKQRQPGYIGSGGFILGTGQGSFSNGGSDGSLSGFSYFGKNKEQTSVFRDINSRTTRIPNEGKGDVERMLSTGDSNNYNMMNYENAEIFLLYYDQSSGNPYSDIVTIRQSNPDQITGEIRLPGLLQDKFGNLKENDRLIRDNPTQNDSIVDRQIRGFTKNNNTPFTVYSTESLIGSSISTHKDSVFRESDINNPLQFKFKDKKSPISKPNNRGDSITTLTVISQAEDNIKNKDFNQIFQESGVQLRFALLNLLEGSGKNNYPFLEYYADFGKDVADKYYTINAEGNFKDFQVNTIIQKPTIKETILGSFTSIF